MKKSFLDNFRRINCLSDGIFTEKKDCFSTFCQNLKINTWHPQHPFSALAPNSARGLPTHFVVNGHKWTLVQTDAIPLIIRVKGIQEELDSAINTHHNQHRWRRGDRNSSNRWRSLDQWRLLQSKRALILWNSVSCYSNNHDNYHSDCRLQRMVSKSQYGVSTCRLLP